MQKNICEHANSLHPILNVLEKDCLSRDWKNNLEKEFSSINTLNIPTTGGLRKICKDASFSDYVNLEFPKRIPESSVTIEDVSNRDIAESEQFLEKLRKSSQNKSFQARIRMLISCPV